MTRLSFGLSPTPCLASRGGWARDRGLRARPVRAAPVRAAPRAALGGAIQRRLVPAAVPAGGGAVQFSLGERAMFLVSEYLMWHPGAKVVALFVVTLVGILLGSLLFRAADPARAEAASPFWHAVRAVANPLEDDWMSVPLRTVSIVLASVGMVVFAILVGMVTESVETAVRNADGGYSRVVARDHTVILGWGSRLSQTLRDLSTGGAREKVVVLAGAEERPVLMQELRGIIESGEASNIRFFFREGVPVLSEDLRRVSASTARKIVLVNSRAGDPVDCDRKVLSRALALSQNIPDFRGDIVAELNNERDEKILRSILSRTRAQSIETVNADRLLFRFMAQAIRQPGLADIVARLMGGDKSSVFHVQSVGTAAPQLVGVRYADVRPTSIPGALICGYFGDDGQVRIHSPSQAGPTLTARTNLLILGRPGSAGSNNLSFKKPVRFSSTLRVKGVHTHGQKRVPETFLVCGWRPDMEDMLRELDKVLPSGSKMTILDDDAPQRISLKLRNLAVTCVVKRPDRYENLEELLAKKGSMHYDHVVLLGSALGVDDTVSALGADEDSKALATMVYVNELLESRKATNSQERDTYVTVEFNHERVAEIARERGNVANAILPQNLGAKIAAQTMRDSRLNSVWRELLSQQGHEVYLVPAEPYLVKLGAKQSFRSIADTTAREKDEMVIGFVPKGQTPNINPTGADRFESRTWAAGDVLVVLARDK